MNTLDITPIRKPIENLIVPLPGSKSLTNRALMLAALSGKATTLTGALFSRDTRIMCKALETLGFAVTTDESKSLIKLGPAKKDHSPKETKLHVGNAGTAARFLTAYLALNKDCIYHLDGDEAMRKRPMQGLLDALQEHGAADIDYQGEAGFFPFTMKSKGLKGGTLRVNASASSQILSALLMIAPQASEPLAVELIGETVSKPFVTMTVELMKRFGYIVDSAQSPYRASLPQESAAERISYAIEPDATAASYFTTLPYITGGSITIENIPSESLQGDTEYCSILNKIGLNVEQSQGLLKVSHTKGQKLKGGSFDFNAISDTFLTLAAIAPLLEGTTTITGIAHTRKQETDRIHAMATELKKLGQGIEETEDSLTIHPAPLKPASIHTYEDHRVAMSFGILGCHDLNGDGSPWIRIEDPECCGKTFPHFFDVLKEIQTNN